MTSPDSDLTGAVEFLNCIGIPTELRTGSKGFLGAVRIVDGQLLVDPLCPVSDLLHEAGHIAIVPKRYRHLLNDDVSKGHACMLEDVDQLLVNDFDHPLYVAVMQSGDPEATAWAWAAGVHLGIAPEKIILDHQYERGGSNVRLALSVGQYAGINGIARAGFCGTNRVIAHMKNIPCFPELAFWTQEVDCVAPTPPAARPRP